MGEPVTEERRVVSRTVCYLTNYLLQEEIGRGRGSSCVLPRPLPVSGTLSPVKLGDGTGGPRSYGVRTDRDDGTGRKGGDWEDAGTWGRPNRTSSPVPVHSFSHTQGSAGRWRDTEGRELKGVSMTETEEDDSRVTGDGGGRGWVRSPTQGGDGSYPLNYSYCAGYPLLRA